MCNSFVTPWAIACQVPLSTGFPRQEYWRGLPFPPPGDLPDPGMKPTSMSPALQADSLPSEPSRKPIWNTIHPLKRRVCSMMNLENIMLSEISQSQDKYNPFTNVRYLK